EVNLNISAALTATTGITFTVHSDSAPTFYVVDTTVTPTTTTKPPLARTDPRLRKLERDIAALTEIDPYVSLSPTPVTHRMADAVGMKALHMVTADPQRTPTFVTFAGSDYFISTFGPSCGGNPCIDFHFAWSHGDFQDDIGNNWVGLVGPGVRHLGVNA